MLFYTIENSYNELFIYFPAGNSGFLFKIENDMHDAQVPKIANTFSGYGREAKTQRAQFERVRFNSLFTKLNNSVRLQPE